jgi:hypothetical protein
MDHPSLRATSYIGRHAYSLQPRALRAFAFAFKPFFLEFGKLADNHQCSSTMAGDQAARLYHSLKVDPQFQFLASPKEHQD